MGRYGSIGWSGSTTTSSLPPSGATPPGPREPLLRLLTALTLFFELRSHLAEGGRWFARALAHDGAPAALRARALWGAAHVALVRRGLQSVGALRP